MEMIIIGIVLFQMESVRWTTKKSSFTSSMGFFNNGHVNIAINRFCDPDGSIFTSNYLNDNTNVAQIILNKGGQSINLIYVDDDSSNIDTTGYWMLLDNNFDFI